MEIKVSSGEITQARADAIVLGATEGTKTPAGALAAVDKALGGAVAQLIKRGQLKGKLEEVNILNTLGNLPSPLVAVVGLGKAEELTLDKVRGAAAEVCRALRKRKAESLALAPLGVGLGQVTPEACGQALAEGALLGLYSFRKYLAPSPDYTEVKQVEIVAGKAEIAALKQGVATGEITARAVNLARDMVNEPSNHMTPADMAHVAQEIAQNYGLDLAVLERADMEKLGMGALLGVTQGSDLPPKFMLLTYKGKPGNTIDLALIGKAITFDSGGISIKPSEKMGDMKADMTGGASVLAAMGAIAQLKPKINIVGAVAAAENMPSGHAYRPGDIVRAMNGKTIEVISTDAEGRLTLADVLSYINAKVKAKRMVDVATLTGACVIALGNVASAILGNNQPLIDRVIQAGKEAGEKSWQLPLFEEYKEQNKSDVADLKNTGGRPAGTITAAYFLAEFAGDTPWVHMDIAGVDLSEKECKCFVKGASGIPVRTLVNLALDLAQNPA